MTEPTKASPAGNGTHGESKRAESQATLSAIGDVSVAATEQLGQVAPAPHRTHWFRILAFLLLAYLAGAWVAIYTHNSAPWVQAFIAPLPLALIATLAFWRRQVWKYRARDWRFKEKARQNALNSLAHETANGLNALRANLTGFQEAESFRSAAEHLKQLERSLGRIDTALQKAIADPSPQPAVDSKTTSAAQRAKAA